MRWPLILIVYAMTAIGCSKAPDCSSLQGWSPRDVQGLRVTQPAVPDVIVNGSGLNVWLALPRTETAGGEVIATLLIGDTQTIAAAVESRELDGGFASFSLNIVVDGRTFPAQLNGEQGGDWTAPGPDGVARFSINLSSGSLSPGVHDLSMIFLRDRLPGAGGAHVLWIVGGDLNTPARTLTPSVSGTAVSGSLARGLDGNILLDPSRIDPPEMGTLAMKVHVESTLPGCGSENQRSDLIAILDGRLEPFGETGTAEVQYPSDGSADLEITIIDLPKDSSHRLTIVQTDSMGRFQVDTSGNASPWWSPAPLDIAVAAW
jgi:hypothetical protein